MWQSLDIGYSARHFSWPFNRIGIRVKRWIAYHGFALNVSNDLTKYKKIVPCGLKDKSITSLKNMGIKNYDNIEKIIIKKFLSTFL